MKVQKVKSSHREREVLMQEDKEQTLSFTTDDDEESELA